jgi:hypothetical protein
MDWKEKLSSVSNAISSMLETELEEHLKAINPLVKALSVPPGWEEIKPEDMLGGIVFASRVFRGLGMVVIVGVNDVRAKDGTAKQWLHLSVSRKSKMPSYEDLVMVRRFFMDESKPSYQVFPAKAEHRNMHDYCLHLWMPLENDPFPDVFGDRAATVAP